MLNIKIVIWSLGIFAAINFVLCVIYGLIVPPILHSATFFEAAVPVFKWLTFAGSCLGLIEISLYAYAQDWASSPSTTLSSTDGLLQQRISSDEARKPNHWRSSGDGKDDDMNKDLLVQFATFVSRREVKRP